MPVYIIKWHTQQTEYTRRQQGKPFTVSARDAQRAKDIAIDAIYHTYGVLMGGVVIDEVTEQPAAPPHAA